MLGAVEVDTDRVDDGKCTMSSPRAVLSARRRSPGVASRSRCGPGRIGVDADEGERVVELPEGVDDVEEELVEVFCTAWRIVEIFFSELSATAGMLAINCY
jgi:hypothetical protein